MSQQEDVHFLPYEEAARIVAAIQEEEDIDRPNHRVLTVYNHDDKEICWFDFDEVMQAVSPFDKEEERDVVTEYILRHLPDWVLDY
jgi:hypothetical protein